MRTLEILADIERVVYFIMTFFFIYQLVIWCFAFTREKPKKKLNNKKHRFMAVISARNEENVIANLIYSLKKQDYPQDKLDIYVIADNCTDSTANVAREAGAIVLERFNQTKRSKGYALEWFFDTILSECPNKYDAFCVFDADNVVAKDFYAKMNNKLCEGEKIVQGYRDIKNAGDTWVTSSYAIFYWMMNRFYHYTRYKIGLSPLINGTGFMVSMDVIKENNGWHTSTMTEDIEFSLKSIAKGYTIGWAHNAVVYDEQPQGFEQSCTQRLRWSVGHIQCFNVCFPQIIKNKKVTPTLIDAAIYTLGMPMLMVSVAVTILNIIRCVFVPVLMVRWIKGLLVWGAMYIMISVIQALFSTLIENKDLRKVWKGILLYPVFLISWVVINLGAFFNRKIEWKQIKHVKAVNIQEMQ